MAINLTGIVGNLTHDPELRFTPKGDPVASFSIAINERIRQGNEWVDGKPEFLRCEAWGALGENICESVGKGATVIINGRLTTETYRTREGEDRTALKVRCSHVGVDLGRQTARAAKTTSTAGVRE